MLSYCIFCLKAPLILHVAFHKSLQTQAGYLALILILNFVLENLILRQNNYPWKQILDTGGIKTNTIGINKFPSNFLLDQKGKIIAKDINPIVLENYLDSNLAQPLVNMVEDAFKIKDNEQLFINRPLKELLKEIKPPIKRVMGNPRKYNHEGWGYFVFNFVDEGQCNLIRSIQKIPVTVVVYVNEFFDWDFQKRPKGRETIWTTDDEKRFENLTVKGFRVYGDASSND